VLVTAGGLVFQGSVDGRLNAYDARTGKLLKSIDTGVAIMAAPMTYRVGKTQYVAVQAGWGGGGWPYAPPDSATAKYGPLNRLFVFRLDGGGVRLPDALPPLIVAPEPPPQAAGVGPETIARGRGLFFENCAICHSNQPRSPSPDLRRLDPAVHEQFKAIVRGGLFAAGGMPRWDDLLTEADVDAIHAFLIDEQAKVRARELKLQAAGLPLDTRSAAILSSF
jgi:quinohemoprotein ethanol dehydrogenase